jgi:hypothetical protein
MAGQQQRTSVPRSGVVGERLAQIPPGRFSRARGSLDLSVISSWNGRLRGQQHTVLYAVLIALGIAVAVVFVFLVGITALRAASWGFAVRRRERDGFGCPGHVAVVSFVELLGALGFYILKALAAEFGVIFVVSIVHALLIVHSFRV